MIAAECEPWAKTGGLGDVVDALARALGGVPGATDGDGRRLPAALSLRAGPGGDGRLAAGPRPGSRWRADGTTELTIVDVAAERLPAPARRPPAGVRSRRDVRPTRAAATSPTTPGATGCSAGPRSRRSGPSRSARSTSSTSTTGTAGPAAIQRDAWLADDPILGRAAIVMTLHNLAYHGWTGRDQLGQLGLVPGGGVLPADADGVDLIREGIVRAEVANTVSPGFAREALTPEGGFGLADALAAKGDRFVGILNGLDTDALGSGDRRRPRGAVLGGRPDAARRPAGPTCSSGSGFDPADDGAVLGMIGRLDPQKGFDLIHDAAPRLLDARRPDRRPGLRRPARWRPACGRWRPRSPTQVALIERFDRAMARRIYAGADFFLMPSRFEPCGTGQMISLRYGTPPIVRRTGGLADSVIDERTRPGEGTGFAFDAATPDALAEACEAAMAMRAAGGAPWDALVARGMAVDFDWARGSAPATRRCTSGRWRSGAAERGSRAAHGSGQVAGCSAGQPARSGPPRSRSPRPSGRTARRAG